MTDDTELSRTRDPDLSHAIKETRSWWKRSLLVVLNRTPSFVYLLLYVAIVFAVSYFDRHK